MMTNNAHLGDRSGAAKRGLALLASLLRCRRCGRSDDWLYRQRSVRAAVRLSSRSLGQRGQAMHFVRRLGPGSGNAKEILGVVEPAAVEAAMLTRICYDDTIAVVLTQ